MRLRKYLLLLLAFWIASVHPDQAKQRHQSLSQKAMQWVKYYAKPLVMSAIILYAFANNQQLPLDRTRQLIEQDWWKAVRARNIHSVQAYLSDERRKEGLCAHGCLDAALVPSLKSSRDHGGNAIAKLLLEHKAHAQVAPGIWHGEAPLSMVFYSGQTFTDDLKLVQLLIERKGDVNHVDESGIPLLARIRINPGQKVMQCLLDAGLNPMVKDSRGQLYVTRLDSNAMGQEIMHMLCQSIYNQSETQYQAVVESIESGAQMASVLASFVADYCGILSDGFLEALHQNDEKCVGQYLTLCPSLAQPYFMVWRGIPPLYYALADRRSTNIVKQLLDKKAPANAQNSYGRNALYCLYPDTSLETVQLLLDHNADPGLTDVKGRTALESCSHLQQTEQGQKVFALLQKALSMQSKNKSRAGGQSGSA